VEANTFTQVPLIFLCLCSICTGFLFNDLFVGINSDFLTNSILIAQKKNVVIEHEFLFIILKQLPFLVSLLGVFLMYKLLTKYNLIQYCFSNFFMYNCLRFLNQKWFFDKLYNLFLLQNLKNLYFSVYIFLDKGMLEFIGPTGIYNFNNRISLLLLKYQTGNLGDYLFYMFCSFSTILVLLIYFF
jgi:NADH:ubiquinone oxidoreductase subunit 5 (subunit L)/multisubunit Na+/H+ antiporter MnhA subunit